MKIYCSNEKRQRIYLQKRDLIYLQKTGRYCFQRAMILKPNQHFETLAMNEFVAFEKQEIISYFLEQKDILDYEDYLLKPTQDILDQLDEELQSPLKNKYRIETYQELALEKEGIQSLPYPIDREARVVKNMQKTKFGTYYFYQSAIPHLYFYQKQEQEPFSSYGELPCYFTYSCEKLLDQSEKRILYTSGYNQAKDTIFLFCTNKSKKKIMKR